MARMVVCFGRSGYRSRADLRILAPDGAFHRVGKCRITCTFSGLFSRRRSCRSARKPCSWPWPWDRGAHFRSCLRRASGIRWGMTNYGIGRWLPEGKLMRWLRVDPSKAQRWRTLVQRYGYWSALLCWLPVIGDPIAIALGLFRTPAWPVLVLMFMGKAVRYAVLVAAVRGGEL